MDVVKALVAAGANVNAANRKGETALMEAADDGYADAVRALLAAGADRNMRDRRGETALDKARREHRSNVVSILQN